jgi:hypothetical protein
MFQKLLKEWLETRVPETTRKLNRQQFGVLVDFANWLDSERHLTPAVPDAAPEERGKSEEPAGSYW